MSTRVRQGEDAEAAAELPIDDEVMISHCKIT
jgi:hypothetical protein